MTNPKINPTKETYDDLNKAYEFFNKRLFGSKLPRCLVTLQRKSSAAGFFANKKFATRDGEKVTDEIALNPQTFKSFTTRDILQTLVHEMVHQRQYRFGTPSRAGYHNQEWGEMMKEIGLYPSSTGKPGGAETGQRMGDYLIEGGAFAVAAEELIKSGCDIRYVETGDAKKRKVKAESKTKYSCPQCGANVWGKPDLALGCLACEKVMVPVAPG
jgi:predicted SprT family Zn-dependent metalloprotease